MTLEERGAYITLLAWSWEHGPVPNDMKRIAAILGTHMGAARRLWSEVCRRWQLDNDGQWINGRLERVRAESLAFMERQRANGRLGGRPKKTQPKATDNPVVLETDGLGNPFKSSPISSLQSPDPLRKERSGDEIARATTEGRWRPATERPSQSTALVNGSQMRVHGTHAFCGRKCVTEGLHAEFLDDLGGDRATDDAWLRAWYPTVLEKYTGQRIGDDRFDFWRNEFRVAVGTVTGKPVVSGKGNASRDAMQRVLAKRIGGERT